MDDAGLAAPEPPVPEPENQSHRYSCGPLAFEIARPGGKLRSRGAQAARPGAAALPEPAGEAAKHAVVTIGGRGAHGCSGALGAAGTAAGAVAAARSWVLQPRVFLVLYMLLLHGFIAMLLFYSAAAPACGSSAGTPHSAAS